MVFLAVLVYVMYYFFYSPNFKLTEIEIRGRENISEFALKNIVEEQFDHSRFLIFRQDNIFMFSKGLARKNIKNSYVLDELIIDKQYPHKISISIKEKVSTVVWVTKKENVDRYYYLDLNGVVLGEMPILEVEKIYTDKKIVADEKEKAIEVENDSGGVASQEQGSIILPLIYDLSNSEVKIKEQVLDGKAITFIIELSQKFAAAFPNIKVKHFATPELMTTRVHIITEKGWAVYFESAKNLDAQLQNLKLVLEGKIKDPSKIQYIDLRFDDRVYYK